MGIDFKYVWRRSSRRSDMTIWLTHLTKPEDPENLDKSEWNTAAVENLIHILKEGVLRGSSTEKGFIVGHRRAVCFQSVPLYSIAENCRYERAMWENRATPRYCAVGLSFFDLSLYAEGARPVIYEKTAKAKKMLASEDDYWRIVDLDWKDRKATWWIHEREWRLPVDEEGYQFPLSGCSVVLNDKNLWRHFIKGVDRRILEQLRGVSVLDHVSV